MRKTMLLPFAAAFAAVQVSFAESVPYTGQTEPGEYEISTFTQLTNFTQKVLGCDYAGSTITLGADIDCEGRRFVSGSAGGSVFRGTFDGQGFKIRNFVNTIVGDDPSPYGYGVALFDNVMGGAVIRNLTLIGVVDSSSRATFPYAAAFAAYAEGENAVTFENCYFTGAISNSQSAAVFVGKAIVGGGGSVSTIVSFTNCAANATVATRSQTVPSGGFVADGAYVSATDCSFFGEVGGSLGGGFAGNATDSLFRNCSVSGARVAGAGFVQMATNVTFVGCMVTNTAANKSGFVFRATNGTFTDCTVRDGAAPYGFVVYADDGNTFEDCSVIGTEARVGFVQFANDGNWTSHTNVFRRCRAGCLLTDLAVVSSCGFGQWLKGAGTLVEDCVAYGAGAFGATNLYGFAYCVQYGAVVRRCVGAVMPPPSVAKYAGFAGSGKVEDCYSVYGPLRAAEGADSAGGLQGGFIRQCDNACTRCFALWPMPDGSAGQEGCGSFCGVTNSSGRFTGCYRPAESAVGDVNNADVEGIDALTAAEFASATGATLPGYDFENVWRAPNGTASSPYLAASTDAATNFWTTTMVLSGAGRIVILDGEREAYPAGTVLRVRAIADTGTYGFVRWVGDGFADPTSPETTYTVKNVGVIAAVFTEAYSGQTAPGYYEMSTFAQLTNFTAKARTYDYADSTFFLTANINCRGERFTSGDPLQGTRFCGTFDGKGHRIYNFVNDAALFDTVANGAVIGNLTLEGAVSNVNSAAVFAGKAIGATLTNCTANATVFTATNAPAGGLVAVGEGLAVIDCSFTGRVESDGTLGGLAGRADDSSFTRCAFNGTAAGGPLDAYAFSDGGCGGLVGRASNTVFRACSAQGDIDWDYATGSSGRRTAETNFVAVGGAAGVTLGESAFYDCSFTGTVQSAHGYVAGFVGWTAGSETFSNCTAIAAVNPRGTDRQLAIAGFAASVASSDASFIDCSVTATGNAIQSGFYDVQHECLAAGPVGTNAFLRCSVAKVSAAKAGFARVATNGRFTDCAVREGSASAGFVWLAYGGNAFDGCTVVGAKLEFGFVKEANPLMEAAFTNEFRRCRVNGVFGDWDSREARSVRCGFADVLNRCSIVEDCAAYGVAGGDASEVYGFVRNVGAATAVRRCVAAVVAPTSAGRSTGFAGNVAYAVKIEDCYSVYGPRGEVLSGDPDNGVQGGFVQALNSFQNNSTRISRCFTLWPIPDGGAGYEGCGSFCGLGNPAAGFSNCYRPAETVVGDVNNADDAGVSALTAAAFASATSATLPAYDFANVWRAPNGVASSPYLPASTDAATNFWTTSGIVAGRGYVHLETDTQDSKDRCYRAGERIWVYANPASSNHRFLRWVGEGFDDPNSSATIYTVRNVSVIAAEFSDTYIGQTWPGTYTVSSYMQLTNFMETARRYDYAGSTIILDADIDCGGKRFIAGDPANATVFRGTFDGEGHRIYNFANDAALFDVATNGAVICNLTLEGTVSNVNSAAVFVDKAFGVTLSNCTANATVFTATNAPAGGLVAVGEGVLAIDCSFTGRVESDGTLGGLVGRVDDSSFTRCAFNGTAYGGPREAYAFSDGGCGGLVGRASNTVFRACSVQGDIDWDYATGSNNRRTAETNFVAVGGAAGVTLGESAFYDCSFTGTVKSVHGYVAGFVGWTAGSETFSNCTAIAALNPGGTFSITAIAGFAASVASSDAAFIDCSVTATGRNIQSGFYDVQHECLAAGPVGTNAFLRCSVVGMTVDRAGFARETTNGVFRACAVRGGSAPVGFVGNTYGDNVFDDCLVLGTEVTIGFVNYANEAGSTGCTNTFQRCRVGGVFKPSNGPCCGFGAVLSVGSLVEDCVAYGAAEVGVAELYGFVGRSSSAAFRRSVGAVLPPETATKGAGFAGRMFVGSVEDCYSVYGPVCVAADDDSNEGMQGGFLRNNVAASARCFALWPILRPTRAGCGSFCGVADSFASFTDCYRPAETAVGDVNNADVEGIDALTAAEFAAATSAALPAYDFENVWRAPNGLASSPYLAASTDDATNFWTITAVATGKGRVLVKDGDEYVEPAAAYPAGTVLTVRAFPDPHHYFIGWTGGEFADPSAEETTYTVRNVGAITALFTEPYAGQRYKGAYTITSFDQLTNLTVTAHRYSYSGSTFILDADIDCNGRGLNTTFWRSYSTFTGTFDGNGHTVRNFMNTAPGRQAAMYNSFGVALFDIARNGAVFRNLTLEGVVTDDSGLCTSAAAFVSSAQGENAVTFENCHFRGAVSNTLSAAAFVAHVSGGSSAVSAETPVVTLTNCTASASIFTATNAPAGGLVAEGTGVLAIDCAFTGRVESAGTLGGIAGLINDSLFTRCTFNGTAYGGPRDAYAFSDGGCGGLVGRASNTVFRACFAQGDIDWDYATGSGGRRTAETNFVAVGGAAGVTLGESAFYDCSFTGTVQSAHGYVAGFVGWTAGTETFSNCTAIATVNPNGTNRRTAIGGFAASVASSDAKFIDCSVTATEPGIQSGFYDVQHERLASGSVGTNLFLRCSVEDTSASRAGFAGDATNGVFRACAVRGGAAPCGFVDFTYGDNEFEDCLVLGTEVTIGFVDYANIDNSFGCTNTFRRCRVGGVFRDTTRITCGFGYMLCRGVVAEDCVAYGAAMEGVTELYGFANTVAAASVRRCVGAVLPPSTVTKGAGFADRLLGGSMTVEDCYSVFGPQVAAVADDGVNGVQGGFVRSSNITSARCFALWPLHDDCTNYVGCGSFCGVTNSTACFTDCYRPAESAVGAVNNMDVEGVASLGVADFQSAQSFPSYDFENVWRAPNGLASSPYLAASTDASTNLWLLTSVVSGKGRILVNGEPPAEAYPAGAVLNIKAVSDEGYVFTGWIGEGFADPLAPETTYTVRNVGVAFARFDVPPYNGETEPGTYGITTFAQLTNLTALARTYDYAGSTFVLGNDIDCEGASFASGDPEHPSLFSGTFDGNGRRIVNFTNTLPAELHDVFGDYGFALFDVVTNGAAFRNLTLEGVVSDTSGRREYVAAFAAYALGENAATFENCHFTGAVSNRHSAAVFVGKATGVTFTNCTANASVYTASAAASVGGFIADATGVVAADCSFTGSVRGYLSSGFVGSAADSAFDGCSVADVVVSACGFVWVATNTVFTACLVQGCTVPVGFVGEASGGNVFEDCAVLDATVRIGFVRDATPGTAIGCTNLFRRCRAGCLFESSSDTVVCNGFAGTLRDGSLVEDCAAYGAGLRQMSALYGFVGELYAGAVVRRCVGAALPYESTVYGAGFANAVHYGATVGDCYSVYGPRAAATAGDSFLGVQGGFVRRIELDGQTPSESVITNCLAVWPIPSASAGQDGCGSFCGIVTGGDSTSADALFLNCSRPLETAVNDVNNVDIASDGIVTVLERTYSWATGWEGFDCETVWRMPNLKASSPYLAASTDDATNFWTFAAVTRGRGRILVKDGDDYVEPAEAYPAGTVLTVRAVPDEGYVFRKWSGKRFADPTVQETTYTVRNVSVISAMFAVPYAGQTEPGDYTISTFDQLTNLTAIARSYDYAGSSFSLHNDIDCEGLAFASGDPEQPSTFSGEFNGNGFAISNFVNETALFDVVTNGALICNLTLDGTVAACEADGIPFAAAFAAYANGENAVTFDNCHFTGVVSNHASAAVFVGKATGATLRNCTANAMVYAATDDAPAGGFVADGTGVVATDCSFTGVVRGARTGGFVGVAAASAFNGCSVEESFVDAAGFVQGATNSSFTACTVRGGIVPNGFALYAYGGNVFEDCAVQNVKVETGFVRSVNPDDDESCTNVFRRCRAGGVFDNRSGHAYGFANTFRKGTVVEDCVAYGVGLKKVRDLYGFAGEIGTGAVVRRCVGAVKSPVTAKTGAGFADVVMPGALVADSYSVYGPTVPAASGDAENGVQGGFVRSSFACSEEGNNPIARCFALWPVPESDCVGVGSFCGVVRHAQPELGFVDCFRPDESILGAVNNMDVAGITSLPAADFQSAQSFPTYDFEDVWRTNAPASSPCLPASTDANTNFWTLVTVARGSGRILVDGEEPAESYPAGAVLTVSAIPDEDNLFLGWVGDGFADPASPVTTYTVKNVGAIAVTFKEPYVGQTEEGDYTISRFDQLRLFNEKMREYDYADASFTLYHDIDCGGGQSVTADMSQTPSRFSGLFDGAGLRICNFTNCIRAVEGLYGLALFDVASNGAVIRNLTLEGKLAYDYYGGTESPSAAAFVARAEGANAVTFENCHFIGSINAHKSAAAFVGIATGGPGFVPAETAVVTLTNCTVNATVEGGREDGSAAGGFVADGEGVVAVDCSFVGKVDGTRTVGGIAGRAVESLFARCVFDGEVRGGYIYASVTNVGGGGIVGFASNATVRACFATGNIAFIRCGNFTAGGGIAGVTMGESAFFDSSFSGAMKEKSGELSGGGFVGWTAGTETFSNCTASVSNAIAGFAMYVASSEALFMDCAARVKSDWYRLVRGGFYGGQEACRLVGPVGTNRFIRCSVADSEVYDAGFAGSTSFGVFIDCVVTNVQSADVGFAQDATNATFIGCSVMDSSADGAGFARNAADALFTNCTVACTSARSAGFAQTATNATFASCAFLDGTTPVGFVANALGGNVFEDCAVEGTDMRVGFVRDANPQGAAGLTNEFRRCRVGGVFRNSSGACHGFAANLKAGSVVEDCVAYGASPLEMGELYGFAGTIGADAAVRRSVGALLPPVAVAQGAGFANAISAGATVEDCYSVYGPHISANGAGMQGGFARTSGGAVARSFALWPVPNSSLAFSGNGSFCGTSADSGFADCLRPAESAVGDVNNADAAGIGALTASAFASATSVALPAYDFANVWRAPNGVASSPYLAASTDAATNFWTLAFVASGDGRIRVNGAEAAAAYAPGTVLTVRAEPGDGYLFSRWIGDGFANPNAQETTYTVRNVGVIAAVFAKTISSRADFEAIPTGATGDYALMNDLDFSAGGGIAPRQNFKGRFLGNGHSITGLSWTGGAANATNALFASISNGAVIRDLTVASAAGDGKASVAGLVRSVGHASLVSNCHARVSFQGTIASGVSGCDYFGLIAKASGSDVRILDCTAEGEMSDGGIEVGFIGSTDLFHGEIARCAAFCGLSAAAMSGRTFGFAGSIALDGGSTVRECFVAGFADSAHDASGFANTILFRDTGSFLRDCYSTAEVDAGLYIDSGVIRVRDSGSGYGIAKSITGCGPNVVSNVWFGGTVHSGYSNFVFAAATTDVALANCAYVEGQCPVSATDGTVLAPSVVLAGVTTIPFASRLQRASWSGYDLDGVWSMTEGSTTPYFAWSIPGNAFRLFSAPHPSTAFTLPASAAPGASAAVRAAVTTDEFFFHEWSDACGHSSTASSVSASDTTILADNHRTVRAVWGKSIRDFADLKSITNNLIRLYGLVRNVDCGDNMVGPVASESYPFSGTFLGHGYSFGNLRMPWSGTSNVGLFVRMDGATVADVNFTDIYVSGKDNVGVLAGVITGDSVIENVRIDGCTIVGQNVVGALAGSLEGGASVRGCSSVGAKVSASGDTAGGLIGSVNGASVSRAYAVCDVEGQKQVGGFVGAITNSVVSECFSLGTAKGVQNNGSSADKYVGGFAGRIADNADVSDCYTLAETKGYQYVGGFAGEVAGTNTTLTRCYMAGTVTGVDTQNNRIGKDVGGFVGLRTGGPSFTNCVYCCDDLTSVTYQQASRTAIPGIVQYAPEAMRTNANFAAYHAAAAGGPSFVSAMDPPAWAQIDGATHPYFTWCLEGGKLPLYGRTTGLGARTISCIGHYSPGTDAALEVSDGDDKIFLGWTGDAAYDDRGAYATTVLMDNVRVVNAAYGTAITNVAGLFAVTNAPDAAYGLAADIDLTAVDWTPLCTSANPFTGSFYGRGYTITGLNYESYFNNSAARPRTDVGLFGCVKDATLDGIVLEDVAIGGYSYTGALAGEVQGTSTLRDCFASGTVVTTNTCAALLVGRIVSAHGTTFENCAAEGHVVKCSTYAQNTGGLIGAIDSSEVAVVDCTADVDIDARSQGGGFIGKVTGTSGSVVFTRCVAEGDIAADSTDIGGFVGEVTGLMRCNGCTAKGAVVGSSSSVGGFVGNISKDNCVFTDCAAEGAVSGSGATGGFVGYTAYAKSNEFYRCTARGSVTGVDSGNIQYVGGFIGNSSGDFARFIECDAFGNVSGGIDVGGFVGRSTSAGGRHEQCRAFGNVTASSTQIGGFVGEIGNSNVFSRCMAVGSVFGSYRVGGFAGISSANGKPLFISECFALGDVTATYEGTSGSMMSPAAGGFVGYAYISTISDSYCLGTVRAKRQVGGFAGYVSGSSFVRCYTAGIVVSSGTYVGGFIGEKNTSSALTFEDCALLYGGFHAIGSSTARVSSENEDISELDDAGFKQRANFASYLATGVWLQQDGVTQPYLAWSSPDGKLSVFSVFGGSASGTVSGAGEFAAGSTVAISATAGSEGFFASWAGSTSYADPKSSATTLALDNHRVAAANFGLYLHNADELQSLTNRLTGVFGLANDIDVSGRDWRPIGDGSRKFTGELYGFGHEVTGLVCTNSNSEYRGLFGTANSAVLDGITVSGSVFGKQYVGGLVGRAENGTVIRDCHAVVDVTASYSPSRAGGLVGACDNGEVEVTILGCSVEGSVSGSTVVGGLVGYVADVPFSCSNSTANCEITVGQYGGGFVGQSISAGTRYSQCRAFGRVMASSYYAGGFVGYVSGNHEFWRCMAAGATAGNTYVGGFAGTFSSGTVGVEECLAIGDATAIVNGDASVGGFVGNLQGTASFVDSYCLGTVSGKQKVGGFAGNLNSSGKSFTRCYAAGLVVSGGSYAGGFIGYPSGTPACTNCAILVSEMHAIGSSSAGQTILDAGIAELDANQFRQRSNFAAYHERGVWEQIDGVTQPYLAWSAVGGKLYVGSTVGGSGSGTVEGIGEFSPGAVLQVVATGDDDGFFTYWSGATPYADRTNSTTTISLDNHRIVSASFGRYIRTADELQALTNTLAGVYGLANDINVSGRDWNPIGNSTKQFTGELYGFGHEVAGLVCTNRTATFRGLFGATSGAILEGLTVTGQVVGNSNVGGLVGRAENGTTIRDCTAIVDVQALDTYSKAGGLVGSCENGSLPVTISGCRSDGFVRGRQSTGGLVGLVNMPFFCTNSVVRGDVCATSNSSGGFVGHVSNSSVTFSDCWCSGAVWGAEGSSFGTFAGYVDSSASFIGCRSYSFMNGLRPALAYAPNTSSEIGVITAAEIEELSRGWPKVARRDRSATPIRTKADLLAVTNDLSGCYVLVSDIDLGGEEWTPIGQNDSGKYFTGEFYGHNHAISNFTVNTTQKGAGLFGAISNGRVSGVRAYGAVTGSAGYVGGFAGIIRAGSLVDGCSFVGSVTNSGSSAGAGGFVGTVETRATIMRSFASADVAMTGSGDSTGGFAGKVLSGFISDCYALSTVNSGDRRYVGGFLGQTLIDAFDHSGLIKVANCWCSGEVTSTGSNTGAFGGSIGSSSSMTVTNSYYDSSATALLAKGTINSGQSEAHAGITPLTHDAMLHQTSFGTLDFTTTWGIDEGESTPYLLTFLVTYDDESGYGRWLADNGLPVDADPADVTNGVPYLIRYAFDVPTEPFAPITGISFDGEGRVVLTFHELNTSLEGVTLRVLSTTDLTDWSEAEIRELTIESGGTLVFPRTDDPARFYKLTAEQ